MSERNRIEDLLKKLKESIPENNTAYHALLVELSQLLDIHYKKKSALTQFALNNSSDAIFWIKSDASIFYANKSACNQLGYSYDELTQMKIFDIDPYFPRDQWESEWHRTLTTKYFKSKSIQKRKDGSEFPVDISGHLLQFEGEDYNCAFIRDISKQHANEQQLQQSINKYKLLAENTNDVIWTMDQNLRFTYISPSVLKLRGFTQDEVMKQSIDLLFTPASLQIAIEAMEIGAKLVQQGVKEIPPQVLELEQPCKDGSTIWTEVIVNTIFNEEGNFDFFLGVTRDISDRKKNQDKLIESEEYLKEAEMIAHIGHWIFDIANNDLKWSDEIFRIFELKPQKFKATYESFLERVHPQDRQLVDQAYSNSIKNKTSYNITHRLDLPGRSLKYVNEKCRTEYDKAGNPIRSIGTVQDVTDRVMTEKEQRNMYLLQKLISKIAYTLNLNDQIDNCIKDLMPEIGTGLNLSAVSIFRHSTINITTQAHLKYLWREDLEQNPDPMIDIIDLIEFPEAYKIFKIDSPISIPDTSELPLELSDFFSKFKIKAIIITPLIVDQNRYGFISFDDRKTCRKWKEHELEAMKAIANMIALAFQREQTLSDLMLAKEKAEEADRLKSVFLTTMSHELRTPLNAVIGYSELLKEFKSPDDIEEFGTLINQSGIRLLNIIEEILNFSLLETGNITLTKTTFKYQNIISDLTKIIENNIRKEQKPIQLTHKDHIDCSQLSIESDSERLTQIFLGLLNNAVKYTKQGWIQFGCNRISENTVEFYVSDSGIGIPEDKYDLIFERFRQLDDSHTRLYGGTGIGLSICKKIVELLDGNIWVESTLGEGSTFFFTIPLQTGRPSDNNQGKSIQYDFSGKTILIAEDEYSNYLLLQTILQMKGARTILAQTGKQAVQIVQNNNAIDLILMDLKMPDMDGYHATKIIKSFAPQIPVIAQTAYAFEIDQQKALNAGCDDYLPKPIKKNIVLNKVAEYLYK